MRRLKILVHPVALAVYMIYAGGAYYGWQGTLSARRAYYQRLVSYYAGRSAQAATPQRATHYQALANTYRDAVQRPWAYPIPKNPEY